MAIPRKSSPTAADNTSVDTSASVSPTPTVVAGMEQADKAGKADKVDKVDKVDRPDSTPAPPSPQPSVSATVPTPHPAVAIPSTASSSSTAPVPDDDLPSILRRLTPIQRAKLRSAAISEGVIQSGAGRANADGSLSVLIRVDGDLVPQLQTWAEEAGVPVEVQIREIVGQLLSGYLMGEWTAPQPVAAPTGEPAAAGK